MFEILNILKPNLADIFSVEEEDITPATRFDEDLGADEMDLQEISMIVEEEFDVLVDDEDLPKLNTVGDLIAYIEGQRHD
ncbi:MAG: acyl carrier protein [Clostridia bacterium]|nr:acyl carrier protein [Clostridia bacterium]MBQ4322623.1 acyl carrier protein [Clostridia bacterium]